MEKGSPSHTHTHISHDARKKNRAVIVANDIIISHTSRTSVWGQAASKRDRRVPNTLRLARAFVVFVQANRKAPAIGRRAKKTERFHKARASASVFTPGQTAADIKQLCVCMLCAIYAQGETRTLYGMWYLTECRVHSFIWAYTRMPYMLCVVHHTKHLFTHPKKTFRIDTRNFLLYFRLQLTFLASGCCRPFRPCDVRISV